jgi:hypothetical protein
MVDPGFLKNLTLFAEFEAEELAGLRQTIQTTRFAPADAAKFWHAVAVALRRRLLQTNDVVRSYFEVNRALVENPTFREAYAMCNR